METFDAIVIGGGTMGTAAGWALAQRGVRALVLEQFPYLHGLGSHSGKTRIIRQAYAESPDYVPLVQRAEALWDAVAGEVGEPILYRTGGLDLAAPGFRQARDARLAAEQHHLPHEWLGGAEIRRRWPVWHLGDEWEACYSPQTGFLVVERALAALAASARRRGVVIRDREPVREWQATNDEVSVRTGVATYRAERLIVTAGAWAGALLRDLALPLTVLRKVVWWLAVDDPAPFAIGAFPIFIAEGPLGIVYGFPVFEGKAVKVANHAGGQVTAPDAVDRTVRPAELGEVVPFLRQALPDVSDRVVESTVCLYTMTPDRDFVVDRYPHQPRVVFAAGFSGHGFKFAPAIGEMLAHLALDAATQPLPRFAVERFFG